MATVYTRLRPTSIEAERRGCVAAILPAKIVAGAGVVAIRASFQKRGGPPILRRISYLPGSGIREHFIIRVTVGERASELARGVARKLGRITRPSEKMRGRARRSRGSTWRARRVERG